MDYRVYNERLFKKYISIYDFSELALSKIRKEVDSLLDLPKGVKVLDVACGTGNQSIALAQNGYIVTGIDISPDMLAVARKKAKNMQNCSFMLADVTVIPCEDREFDASIITFSLHDMPHELRMNVVKEMRRVTKVNGLIVLVDYRVSPRKTFFEKGAYVIPKIWESKYYPDYHTQDLSVYLKQNDLLPVKNNNLFHGIVQVLIAANN